MLMIITMTMVMMMVIYDNKMHYICNPFEHRNVTQKTHI